MVKGFLACLEADGIDFKGKIQAFTENIPPIDAPSSIPAEQDSGQIGHDIEGFSRTRQSTHSSLGNEPGQEAVGDENKLVEGHTSIINMIFYVFMYLCIYVFRLSGRGNFGHFFN